MKNKMKNPILSGFYPDPSICRVDEDFYLVCSSFELCPGVPVFHSKDLVHWEQIGHAVTPENGLHVEKNSGNGGIMAPTLRYHNGLFYMINTNYCDKGNYIVTAENAAGPWSEPHWLTDVPGIDASLFFDSDGQAYIMGTGNVWDNGAGVKERGIWLAPYDIENFCLSGKPITIFNSALRVGASPESPHLYHIGEYYYLMIAEGGTEHHHAVMVARSKELFGFYEGNPANPVMTHRHMGYKCPITNVGHADFVDLPDGSWYAVMLASRLIDGECKNLGRETFICPVVWERDWPLFSPETGKLEWEYDAPEGLPWTEYQSVKEKEDFEDDKLDLCWNFWGTPYEKFYDIQNSKLKLQCIHQALAEDIQPMKTNAEQEKNRFVSFLARRQQKVDVTVTCQMAFMPQNTESAGMAVVQAMNHQYHLERAIQDGRQVVRLVQVTADFDLQPYMPGFTSKTNREVIAETAWNEKEIVLQIKMEHEKFTISYGKTKEKLAKLCIVDGRKINPEIVGCMVGTIVGMFATGNGVDSENFAEFDWFEMI